MVFLKRKIPKATISIEIDTNYSGIIMLDNKETFVDPKVSELILNMIEHIDELNSKLDIYENNFLGKADA